MIMNDCTLGAENLQLAVRRAVADDPLQYQVHAEMNDER